MATTALLTNKTTDGAGAGVSVTGPCSVFFTGNSIFDGARAEVQVALADTDATYSFAGRGTNIDRPEPVNIAASGPYYIRCKVFGAGPKTNISASVNQ